MTRLLTRTRPLIACGIWRALGVAVAILGMVACGDPPGGPTGPDPPLPPPPLALFDPVFVGAGDIAVCGSNGTAATARLLDMIPGTVFTAGDNAYPGGTLAEFRDCYDPTWGRHKGRTRPAPGNHDYEVPGAAAYFAYFGSNAGPAGRGYYSYDLGSWHLVSLNSEIAVGAQSPQVEWLRADLASNPTTCTLAYMHRPLFSSGQNGNNPRVRDIWRVLYEFGVDVMIAGHDHLYERFGPQDPDSRGDPVRGIRLFVVGTGGADLYSFRAIRANSEVRVSAFGVLKLTLRSGSYEWEFVPVSSGIFPDSGRAECH